MRRPIEFELDDVLDLFPSERDPSESLVPSADSYSADASTTHVEAVTPAWSEHHLLEIVPAGPPVAHQPGFARRQHSRPGRQRILDAGRSMPVRLACARSSVRRVAAQVLSPTLRRIGSLTVRAGLLLALAVVRSLIRIARLVQSVKHAVMAIGRPVRSSPAAATVIARRLVWRGASGLIQSAYVVADAAAAGSGKWTSRARCAVASAGRHARGSARQSADRVASQIDRAIKEARWLLSRPRATWPHFGGGGIATVRRSIVSTTAATLLGFTVFALARFDRTVGTPPAVSQALLVSGFSGTVLSATSIGAALVALKPPLPSRRAMASRPETGAARIATITTTAAVQRVLNKYRDAFSTLDSGAVRRIWPSVNAASLRADFDRLDEHNLEYESCQISLAGAAATAVCRGVAQSRPSGMRAVRVESRRWQFELHSVDDRWMIDAVSFVTTHIGHAGH